MNNQFFGILTITLCTIGYFYSWKFQSRENFRIALLLLILCGLALRFFTASDFFLHDWDESYHALVAKNLIQHPLTPTLYDNPILPYDFKGWTANHIWLHKQPLPLWTMAASMWMFGVNEIALRLPSIIFTTIGIWLIYYIAKYFFNKKIAYLSAFFYSINGLIIELTAGKGATDHIDIFFLFFIQVAVFFSILFAQKQKTIYNVLAGISVGAAILSKWLPALIVLPIWLLIVIYSKNFKLKSIIFQFIILASVCVVVFLPWQIYIYKTFPLEAGWEASMNLKHITQSLEGHGEPFYYFIYTIGRNFGEMIYLPLIWFFLKTVKNIKNYNRVALCIWFSIPFLFFSFSETKMHAYLLFTSPALFIMISEFWYMLAEYKMNHKLKWLFNFVLILLIALPVRYTFERIRPFRVSGRSPQWVADLKKLNDKKITNGVLFNYGKPIEAMFYTNLTAYKNIPDENVIKSLIEKNYKIIINDNGNIPADIKAINGVTTEKLTVND